ncbi:MAG: TonB-dependent receptor plug domain-containing protein, partial [Segatella copri]
MNKRANLYFAALLGAMSPLCTVSALAAQSNSTIATATQQQNSCTGTVKDATGEPIIGATIRIEGKTGGTVTDLDGNFTLSNIEKGAKLTITYVGYKSQTLTWSGSPLNITLQDDANMLEETVVIGYGTVKKADLAGSVAVLDSKNFKDQPVARVEDALNGRMSGVQVMSSGVPGGAMKIRVRGTSSVNKSNDPLYVVDGIVRETGLEGISPEDIQSIQVLKDASSTAIYGSRASAGVIMITTKGSKGADKAQKATISYDGY